MKTARFNNYRFRNGKTARNRLVVPPMASQTADARGDVTRTTIEHYHRLSQAGAGIVFAEYSAIHPSGRGEPNQLGVDSWRQVDGLASIAGTIHAAGALAGLQLVHVGGKSSSKLTGSPLMAPSAVAVPVRGTGLEVPQSMSEVEIENWIQWFADAARRARTAGFDIVELHAAHGYGLNQWLSPLTNRRGDSFGGSIAGRARLLLETVVRIRRESPELLLAVRLPAQDYFPGGLEVGEMQWVVGRLEVLGVDLIDVSSGIGGWRRPRHRRGEGYLVEDAALIRSRTRLPVIGVGGIESAAFIEDALENGRVDFTAVGRAILNDPCAWARKRFFAADSCSEMVC